MARSAGKDGESSEAEATTLIFGSKNAWGQLDEAKRQASKRAASANGNYGKLVTKMVKEEHMDRTAIQMALKLNSIEDDSDLHTTIHHLLDGLAKLGTLKRAMVSDALELFDDHKIGPSVRKAKEAAGKTKPDKGANAAAAESGPQGANVKPFPQPNGAAAE